MSQSSENLFQIVQMMLKRFSKNVYIVEVNRTSFQRQTSQHIFIRVSNGGSLKRPKVNSKIICPTHWQTHNTLYSMIFSQQGSGTPFRHVYPQIEPCIQLRKTIDNVPLTPTCNAKFRPNRWRLFSNKQFQRIKYAAHSNSHQLNENGTDVDWNKFNFKFS